MVRVNVALDLVSTEDHRRYPGILSMNEVDWRRAKCSRIFIVVRVAVISSFRVKRLGADWAT
jgi:hypothetical protein